MSNPAITNQTTAETRKHWRFYHGLQLKNLNLIEVLIIGRFYDSFTGDLPLPKFCGVNVLAEEVEGIIPQKTLLRFLNQLTEKGWLQRIDKLSRQAIKKLLCQKTPANLTDAGMVCSWCKTSTYVLESHHYPMLRSEGGTNTVEICPNCHREFHYLLGAALFTPSERLINVFCDFQEGDDE